MNDNKQDSLTAAINALPDGVAWLIRSDETRGFLANVMTAEFSISGGATGVSNFVYADTPILALDIAYKGFVQKQECEQQRLDNLDVE